MVKKIKISYVVPCYNIKDYLPRCLESLASQSNTKEYESEFILVNDGSTDSTLLLLQEFIEKEPRAIIINQSNQGVSVARNAGLRISSGEYVYFLDGDDYLTEDATQIIYNHCKEKQPDILVANAYMINDGIWDKKKEWNPCPNLSTGIYNTMEFAKRINKLPISFKVYRRGLLMQNNIFYDEDLKVGEVYAFFIHALTFSKTIAFTDKRILNYIVRKSGVMRTVNIERDSTIVNTIHRIDEYVRKKIPELLGLFSYQIALFNLANTFGMSNYALKTTLTPDVKKMVSIIRNDVIYKQLRNSYFKRVFGFNKQTLSCVFIYYFPIPISFRLLKIRAKYMRQLSEIQ